MENSVALIGSFKQFYKYVIEAISIFKKMNIQVTSPAGTDIIENGISFVRFTSDNSKLSDELVQTVTLKRIFKATVVYVVAPDGYVGRTTCYEIGRIIQKRKPIYFSERPNDLPVQIPKSHILNPEQLSKLILKNGIYWPFEYNSCKLAHEERQIVNFSI
jgi:hypothetical protein